MVNQKTLVDLVLLIVWFLLCCLQILPPLSGWPLLGPRSIVLCRHSK